MSACPLFPHLLHHSLSASESRTMDSTKHSWENPLGVTHEKNLCKSSYLDAGIMKAHLLRAQLSTVHSRFNCQLRMPLHQNGKSLMEVGVRPWLGGGGEVCSLTQYSCLFKTCPETTQYAWCCAAKMRHEVSWDQGAPSVLEEAETHTWNSPVQCKNRRHCAWALLGGLLGQKRPELWKIFQKWIFNPWPQNQVRRSSLILPYKHTQHPKFRHQDFI